MSKNFVVIVSGIGDTLCSENSKRKLKNSEIFVPQVQKALDHLTSSHNSYALVNLYYPSDTFKDVDVLKPYKQTKVLDMKLNGNTILDKSNELSLRTLDL